MHHTSTAPTLLLYDSESSATLGSLIRDTYGASSVISFRSADRYRTINDEIPRRNQNIRVRDVIPSSQRGIVVIPENRELFQSQRVQHNFILINSVNEDFQTSQPQSTPASSPAPPQPALNTRPPTIRTYSANSNLTIEIPGRGHRRLIAVSIENGQIVLGYPQSSDANDPERNNDSARAQSILEGSGIRATISDGQIRVEFRRPGEYNTFTTEPFTYYSQGNRQGTARVHRRCIVHE